MRICVPTLEERGLEATVSRHFGRSPFFTLVDAATGAASTLSNPAVDHDYGCAPTELLARESVAVVLCKRLGRGAFARLREAGVQVYLTGADSVSSAVAEWRSGVLAEVTAEQLGHGRGHECGHGHHHGHGG